MRRICALLLGLTAFVGSSAGVLAQEGAQPVLRGEVVSATTGDAIGGAWIAPHESASGTYSWNDGHFLLPDVPSVAEYDVRAIGYHEATLSLDANGMQQVVRLSPDPDVLAGFNDILDQLKDRRNRGGAYRVFDRQALAFSDAYSLEEYLSRQRGIARIGTVCLDEVKATGLLQEKPHEFYLAEVFGDGRMLRLYTEGFLEQAAREHRQLNPLPGYCGGA